MKRPSELALEEVAMGTLAEITSAFEGLASMRISQIKDQVMQATQFYHALWSIYLQIRVGSQFRFGRADDKQVLNKELLIIITAEGGFSGDIDFKLVQLLKNDYDPAKNDIIVIGHHGAMQLAQAGIPYKKYFKLPNRDKDINVAPLMREVRQYKSTAIYYQEYLSLMDQKVKRIDLSKEVNNRGEQAKLSEIISESNYIFEPSTFEVVAHLERSMIQIIVGQLILESKLAKYASRFRAMSAAHNRADEIKQEVHIDFNRARRALKDERLKEIINGIKKSGLGAGV